MTAKGITTADLPVTAIAQAMQATLRERRSGADKALEHLVHTGKFNPLYGTATQRATQFQENLRNGYVVIPRNTLINPDLTYSNKRGPWIEYLADRDLRGLRDAIADPRLALASRDTIWKIDVPGQTVGFRFGVRDLARYEALWIDALQAEQMAQALRGRATVVRAEPGVLKIDYGDGIVLTAYGFKQNQATQVTAHLDGYPSTGDEAKKHATQFKLETVANIAPVIAPVGYFSIASGFAPHRAWNRDVLLQFNGYISRHEPHTNRTATIKRIPVYQGDLVGLYLLDAISRNRFKVQLNQPLPKFSAERHLLMETIAKSAIIVSPNRKRSIPNKTQLSQLYSIALGRE